MKDERLARCCFAGHSQVYDANLKDRVLDTVRGLFLDSGVSEFWVGNYGQFDKIAASAVRSLKQELPTISLSLVIPYLTQEINEYREEYYKDYDSIIMADIPENTPRNLKIIKANQFMVDNSDYLVCYVNTSWGGAVKTMEYGLKKNVRVMNLGTLPAE